MRGHGPVVSGSLTETDYLPRNPNNAATLRRSIAKLERGDAAERELIDPDLEHEIA